MDIYSPLNNFSPPNFSIWSYSDLLQSLESRFCLCIPSQGTSETQVSCDLLSSGSHSRLHVSGKTCNARDIHSKLHRSINNDLDSSELVIREHNLKDESSANRDKKSDAKNVAKNAKGVKKRASHSNKLDIKPKLLKLKKRLKNHHASGFTCSAKKSKHSNKYLGRRSKYIGASKNNTNWQALINVNHEKKYIGTFMDEIEAARTYDIYSLEIQGKRARLNFSYTSK